MQEIGVTMGGANLRARFEDKNSPQTCRWFRKLLPFQQKVIHVRWSGEGCWIPMGDFPAGIPFENPTSYPAPGEILCYPGGISGVEILIAYGSVRFASRAGQLAGNHFLTITEGREQLAAIGRRVLWEGAQAITFHGS